MEKVIVKTKQELIDIIQASALDADLNHLNVSQLTDLSYVFERSAFNGDISEWDVSNAQDMFAMFNRSDFNGDISNWNVGNVKDMSSMFSDSKFNGNISEWDVSNVKSMVSMFSRSAFCNRVLNWKLNSECITDKMFKNTFGNSIKPTSKELNSKDFTDQFDKKCEDLLIKVDSPSEEIGNANKKYELKIISAFGRGATTMEPFSVIQFEKDSGISVKGVPVFNPFLESDLPPPDMAYKLVAINKVNNKNEDFMVLSPPLPIEKMALYMTELGLTTEIDISKAMADDKYKSFLTNVYNKFYRAFSPK